MLHACSPVGCGTDRDPRPGSSTFTFARCRSVLAQGDEDFVALDVAHGTGIQLSQPVVGAAYRAKFCEGGGVWPCPLAGLRRWHRIAGHYFLIVDFNQ